MSSGNWTIFAIGLFAMLLLLAGLLYTMRELREMYEHHERLTQEPDFSWLTNEPPAPRKADDIAAKRKAMGKR